MEGDTARRVPLFLVFSLEGASQGEDPMPNFFSAFSSDVFRPIAKLLLPGAIGLTTWVIALMWRFPALKNLVAGNHTETGFILFLAMVFAGMVFEDFGARRENPAGSLGG